MAGCDTSPNTTASGIKMRPSQPERPHYLPLACVGVLGAFAFSAVQPILPLSGAGMLFPLSHLDGKQHGVYTQGP
jgi:hypothetical protein